MHGKEVGVRHVPDEYIPFLRRSEMSEDALRAQYRELGRVMLVLRPEKYLPPRFEDR